MRWNNRLLFCITCCCSLLAATAASAEDVSPLRYLPQADGRLALADSPVDGSRLAVWAYANGSEFDLAISARSADETWSEPVVLGLDDGVNQIQPAVVIGADGTAFVAYATSAGRIEMITSDLAVADWSTPAAVTPRGVRASAPALMIVGNRLILAYRAGRRTVIRDFVISLPDPADAQIGGLLQEGPSPVISGEGPDKEDPGDEGERPEEDEIAEEELSTHFGAGAELTPR